MRYKTLQSALQCLTPQQIIIAQDISKHGQKIFLLDQIENLKQKYDQMVTKHWYECIVENRPTRIFLDIESNEQVNIGEIIDILKKAIEIKFKIKGHIECLESCSAQKQSWHVVCTNIFLKNSYHVGAFVRRLVLSMKDHPMCKTIDTAVYTKNRMFRIALSSKFGSERILNTQIPWYELLCQKVNQEYLTCLEIDESIPISTSCSPFILFEFTSLSGWIKKRKTLKNASVLSECSMLNPILDWLDRNVHACTCRYNTTLTQSSHFRVSTKSKKCQIAQREHKNNKIWFDIHLDQQIVYQKCYDEDCRHKFVLINVPKELWAIWDNTWHQVIHAHINKNALFNLSY